jgi:hypothetical protein
MTEPQNNELDNNINDDINVVNVENNVSAEDESIDIVEEKVKELYNTPTKKEKKPDPMREILPCPHCDKRMSKHTLEYKHFKICKGKKPSKQEIINSKQETTQPLETIPDIEDIVSVQDNKQPLMQTKPKPKPKPKAKQPLRQPISDDNNNMPPPPIPALKRTITTQPPPIPTDPYDSLPFESPLRNSMLKALKTKRMMSGNQFLGGVLSNNL